MFLCQVFFNIIHLTDLMLYFSSSILANLLIFEYLLCSNNLKICLKYSKFAICASPYFQSSNLPTLSNNPSYLLTISTNVHFLYSFLRPVHLTSLTYSFYSKHLPVAPYLKCLYDLSITFLYSLVLMSVTSRIYSLLLILILDKRKFIF